MRLFLSCVGGGLIGLLLAIGGINTSVPVYWPLMIAYSVTQYFAIEALFGEQP